MARRRSQPDQLSLLSELETKTRERHALLDAVGHERSGLSRSRWKNVRALLRAVHRADRGDGCWASTDWLADACEYSRRTLFRARDDALALGLIDIEHRARKTGNGGRDSNLWRVRWKDLARLGSGAIERQTARPPGAAEPGGGRGAAPRGVECQDAEVECHPAEVKCQDGTAIRRVQSLGLSIRDETRATKNSFDDEPSNDGFWDERRVAEASAMRARLIDRVGKLKSRRDLLDATAYVVIAMTRMGEGWLWGGAEGVRVRRPAPDNAWAYLSRVLCEASRRDNEDLRTMMAIAAREYPAELLEPPKRSADLSERLCFQGVDDV